MWETTDACLAHRLPRLVHEPGACARRRRPTSTPTSIPRVPRRRHPRPATLLATDAGETINGVAGTRNDILPGLGGNDIINGLAGNDTIDGGTGADRMNGGTGNDTYVVDNTGDVVTEAANQGIDTIRSSDHPHAADQCREPDLARCHAVSGIGNRLANAILGNDAANLLDGKAGADTLTGFGGSDIYVVESAGDVVIEALNQVPTPSAAP